MGRGIKSVFKFKPFSKKQLKILTWWTKDSPMKDKDGIIADGAIRSGKTVSMSLSYVLWAMETFDQQNLGMAGKTIGSFRRNVLNQLKLMLTSRGYQWRDRRADNLLEVSKGEVTNYFYIFGGKDESSQDLIQGITLAGMFFDEVALMPQSFINQATGRLSVDGSKSWFNCNPDGPFHYFKTEWIDKVDEKHLIYLHFDMDDNLSLSEHIKRRYRAMYSGVFYHRYIKGLWVVAEGVIYDMFDKKKNVDNSQPDKSKPTWISIDYGTQNATVFLMWQKSDNNTWHIVDEYYYSGRENSRQKTDKQFADDFVAFVEDYDIRLVTVDPSAASFIAELRSRGFTIRKANNDVLQGIRTVGTMLNRNVIYISERCQHTITEFSAYVWDDKAANRGEDKPIKDHDHCMDALRYHAYTIIRKGGGVSVWK